MLLQTDTFLKLKRSYESCEGTHKIFGIRKTQQTKKVKKLRLTSKKIVFLMTPERDFISYYF